jgi:hypothetical protein
MTGFHFHTSGVREKIIIHIFTPPFHCTEPYNDGHTNIVDILIGQYPILVLQRTVLSTNIS